MLNQYVADKEHKEMSLNILSEPGSISRDSIQYVDKNIQGTIFNLIMHKNTYSSLLD